MSVLSSSKIDLHGQTDGWKEKQTKYGWFLTRNENIKTCSDDRFKHKSLIMIMKGPQSSVFDVSVVAAACNFLSTFACSPKRQTIDTVGTDSVDHCRAYLKCGEIKRKK